MPLRLSVDLPKTEVSKQNFFQHLSKPGFDKQFHVNWNNRVVNRELYAISETSMPWRVHPIRLFMRPQTAAAKLETVRNLTTLVNREKKAIVGGSQYNVKHIVENLNRIRDRMVRHTQPNEAWQIRLHFNTATNALQEARQAHLQDRAKEWRKNVVQNPASWEAFFKNRRLSVATKVAVAQKIAAMIQESAPLLRYTKVDTQKMIKTLIQVKGRVTNLPKNEAASKKAIEAAFNRAIAELGDIGRLIKKDWDGTLRGWTWNHTLGPVTNRVLLPVVNLPVKVTKYATKKAVSAAWGVVNLPIRVTNFAVRKTVSLGLEAVKLPFRMVGAALSRRK